MDDLWTARRERARRFLATPPTHRQAWSSKRYEYGEEQAREGQCAAISGTIAENTSKDTGNDTRQA